jgi:hypothetical protein
MIQRPMLAPFLVIAISLVALPAWAQIGPSMGGGGYGSGGGYGPSGVGGGGMGGPGRSHNGDEDDSRGGAKDADKPAAPPPAIPGAQPDEDAAVIPAERLAAEMSPNDALFDAINRGDLAAAKDALSRGAQLDAHNVLGQTPTDAAIDLSRNDITFLLLSMRGAVSSGRPIRTASATTAAEKASKARVVKASTQRARPVIADRGTPNPAVGFTGF